ncbi:putative THO complex component [Talaromyces proteolyticus]|uniref:THO complex subunit 2 n=1 Tax=Talaromyces proteolyticus TaxID=1131652 RepID=A0AAD4KZN7_9EURO|nr:putative THO complex component [Talaromyces proteolyticus]KAH8702482.1 putative THO complex component [Talaromyces proteolyticus]
MPPGGGGKRKRGDRSWSGDSGHDGQRPSPHRPGNLNLAQHNQSLSPSPRRGSGEISGRGGKNNRGGRGGFSGRSQPVAQDQQKPAQDTSMTLTSGKPTNVAPEQRQTGGGNTVESNINDKLDSFAYEIVTKEILNSWQKSGKKTVINRGIAARDTNDTLDLSYVFQELIRSVLFKRLVPSEAGGTVRQILEGGRDEQSGREDTSSLFLNTLSILVDDNDTSNDALKQFVFATEIPLSLLRLELDTSLVQGLGLVRETFARIGIRKQTNILYRQSNYNLLREESEGYSKLVTELFTTSNTESPSSENVEETFERVKAMIGAFDLDVGRVLDVTLDVFAAVLVKKYHFFVRFLRASSWWPKGDRLRREEESDPYTGLPSWAIPGWTGFDEEKKEDLARIRDDRDQAFWNRVREIGIRAFYEIGRRPLSEEERQLALTDASSLAEFEAETRKWIEQTGTLPPKGNRVAAQLLGFKLRFYSTAAREAGHLPENLIWVAALLIKIGFISLRDLYPHLWREDESMPELEEKLKKEKLELEMKARPGGGINALMLAGALPDDTLPPPVSRTREAETRSGTPGKDSESTTKETLDQEPPPDIREQKVDLLKSLLTIGAVPEALYMLSRFPWLMDIPELPEYIHRIVHHCLSKIYTPLRPLQGADQLREARKVPSPDQSGVPKGQVRLVDVPPRKLLRWAHPDKEDREDGTNYRFYWDHWADTIPVCQTIDDFFALSSSLLNVSGFKIGQDPLLMSKIARIAQDSLKSDTSENNKIRWRDLCKRLLLPALSLSRKNPGVANEVFGVIRHFPRITRYNMYAEWHFGQTSRQPDIKTAFELATAQTRDTLKRLSKTNIKAMARALAEIAYANPGIVINVEITQIESYDNLIEVVVECARYFTDLGYDILIWALINSLGQKGRSRVQQGGLLTSRWLNALSTFTGKAFKRYSVLNPLPILQYVFEQLRHQNSTDLIILERMISSMAGIVTDTNFNEAQIQAMAGGALLQSQTMLQLLDKRHESKTTSKRLMKALTESKMAGQLLIAIAQERLLCVYRESDIPELKLLGNIFDEIHRILTQYLDLLRSNLTVAEFDSFVPSLPSLVGEFGLQPDIAFWISRPSLSKQIADADHLTKESNSVHGQTVGKNQDSSESSGGDVEMTGEHNSEKIDEPSNEGEMEVEKSPAMADSTNTDIAPTTNGVVNHETTPWHPILQKLMGEIQEILPSNTWQVVGLPFYLTFWQLSIYDVHIPGKAYEDEIERQKRRVFVISNDRTDISVAGTQRKEREKKQIQELQDRLLEENKNHLVSYEQTRNRLQKEKDHWFSGMRGKYETLNLALLEQCFLPRLLLSSIDSFYCFKMMKFLHTSGTPNFRTVGLLDQLLREHRLTAIIFQCTSKEADNFGRFLNEILRDLTRWHADKAVYEKEAWGHNKTLPGFAMNVDSEGKSTSFVDFEMFRRLLYKWHRLLAGALKTCFNGGEYMHIRNGISVLKSVSQNFPAVNWMGRDMLQCVNTLSNDDREDVKIAAASLKGDLSRREKQWLLPQAFMINENVTGEKAKSRSARPDSGTPKPLNATATEFKLPGSAGANDVSSGPATGKLEVEDGEIEDAKMSDAAAAELKGDSATEQAEKQLSETPELVAEALSTTVDQNTASAREDKGQASDAEQQQSDGRARTLSPAQSRQGSRPPDMNRSTSIPKRPDLDRPSRLPPPNLPNKPDPPRYRNDGRSSRQPDLIDERSRDARDGGRHPDFSRSTRYSDAERDRPYDHEIRGRGRSDRDGGDLSRAPPFDEQFRTPRDSRGPPREPEVDRSGRLRPPDSFSRGDAGLPSRSAAQPHPDRADLIHEHPDRVALIEGETQRRDHGRLDREDRRPRPTSPTRPDDRRSHRHGDYPTGPRGERSGRPDLPETRDSRPAPDMSHGRLNQDSRVNRPPEIPTEIPSGPRARGVQTRGRNAPPSTQGTPVATPERPPPTGPAGRSSGRLPDSLTSSTSETGDTSGVHPDRLKNLQVPSEPSSAAHRSQGPMVVPAGPRSSHGTPGSSPITRAPPSGPGADRSRSDKRFAGLNNMLQQTGGSQERGNQGTSIRGRGRQASTTNPHGSRPVSPPGGGFEEDTGPLRAELFPGGNEEDTRASGRGRRNEATDDADLEPKRSGRHANHNAPDRDRRAEEEPGRGGRKDDRRDRGRDRDRERDHERSRRPDIGGEDKPSQPLKDQGPRRGTSGRDDNRKRDRRDRGDGPAEPPVPGNNEHHGRMRPPSSQGSNNVPLPGPPGPPGPPGEDRRWSGSGRGENRDRDRNRERGGGRDRDRDFNREGGAPSGNNTFPRKRGRPGDDNSGHGDGPGRGMRVGSESKRMRRGT